MKPNNNYPLIKPIPERGLKAGRRILRKNSLPATHFVESVKSRGGFFINFHINKIEWLDDFLKMSIKSGHKTIAIFKIRLK